MRGGYIVYNYFCRTHPASHRLGIGIVIVILVGGVIVLQLGHFQGIGFAAVSTAAVFALHFQRSLQGCLDQNGMSLFVAERNNTLVI